MKLELTRATTMNGQAYFSDSETGDLLLCCKRADKLFALKKVNQIVVYLSRRKRIAYTKAILLLNVKGRDVVSDRADGIFANDDCYAVRIGQTAYPITWSLYNRLVTLTRTRTDAARIVDGKTFYFKIEAKENPK